MASCRATSRCCIVQGTRGASTCTSLQVIRRYCLPFFSCTLLPSCACLLGTRHAKRLFCRGCSCYPFRNVILLSITEEISCAGSPICTLYFYLSVKCGVWTSGCACGESSNERSFGNRNRTPLLVPLSTPESRAIFPAVLYEHKRMQTGHLLLPQTSRVGIG